MTMQVRPHAVCPLRMNTAEQESRRDIAGAGEQGTTADGILRSRRAGGILRSRRAGNNRRPRRGTTECRTKQINLRRTPFPSRSSALCFPGRTVPWFFPSTVLPGKNNAGRLRHGARGALALISCPSLGRSERRRPLAPPPLPHRTRGGLPATSTRRIFHHHPSPAHRELELQFGFHGKLTVGLSLLDVPVLRRPQVVFQNIFKIEPLFQRRRKCGRARKQNLSAAGSVDARRVYPIQEGAGVWPVTK